MSVHSRLGSFKRSVELEDDGSDRRDGGMATRRVVQSDDNVSENAIGVLIHVVYFSSVR